MVIMAKKTRLDKFLCDSLNITRKEAKEAVKKGKVTINGEVVKKPECKLDADDDQVEFEHQPVIFEQFHYLMLHKPQGVVSATKDNHDKTVIDLIHEDFKDKLFPVGRLDKDTEGLLLLTDDGMLAHELLSPKKHVDKVYFAKVAGRFTEEEIKRFREGLDIGNGEKAKEAFLEILKAGEDQSEVLITITEGKFHQVKRMAKAVGSEVLYLKRLSMGPLKLDEELEIGTYRRLSEEELHKLKEHTDVRK
nr:pseudouridine synthase [uncultured Anaerostipes sp.]